MLNVNLETDRMKLITARRGQYLQEFDRMAIVMISNLKSQISNVKPQSDPSSRNFTDISMGTVYFEI